MNKKGAKKKKNGMVSSQESKGLMIKAKGMEVKKEAMEMKAKGMAVEEEGITVEGGVEDKMEDGVVEDEEDGTMVDNPGMMGMEDGKTHGQGTEAREMKREKERGREAKGRAREVGEAEMINNDGASPPSIVPKAGTGR